MAVYHLQNYATYPVDQVCVPVSPSPIETKMYGRTYLPAPVQQCYCDTSHLVLPPALTVLGTRDIPLTPTKVSNPMSEKRVGKMLSCYTKNMEMIWHGEFNRLFQNFCPHRWYLSPAFEKPDARKWLISKDSAKVRFLCKICAHGWTSMKGRVVFWFMLDEKASTGIVLFQLFGQKCQACSPAQFEHAMWYPEEVVKVIGNLFNRIGQEYYGFYSPPVRVDRREGKPQSRHNMEMCQACTEGICPHYNMLDGLRKEVVC